MVNSFGLGCWVVVGGSMYMLSAFGCGSGNEPVTYLAGSFYHRGFPRHRTSPNGTEAVGDGGGRSCYRHRSYAFVTALAVSGSYVYSAVGTVRSTVVTT